jgi:hypothetical protein
MNHPTELHKEIARLRKYVELIEIFSPANEWSQPEWRKLVGSKDENEDLETLFRLYQFRLATAPEEDIWEKHGLSEPEPVNKCNHDANGSQTASPTSSPNGTETEAKAAQTPDNEVAKLKQLLLTEDEASMVCCAIHNLDAHTEKERRALQRARVKVINHYTR